MWKEAMMDASAPPNLWRKLFTSISPRAAFSLHPPGQPGEIDMQSTMQDVPLTVTTIMRYACEVNGDRTVTTATGDGGYRTATYRELGEQVGRLANALRELGIAGDDRVGTFMWNNAEHLAAYLAVPSMGAVLHTLNIRLSPEQIAFVA